MAKFVFKVNNVDYSHLVLVGYMDWTKNDIDHKTSARSETTGDMRRKRLTKKRQLEITCRRAKHSELLPLAQALDALTVEITYLDLISGVVTKTFYGSKIDSTQYGNINGEAVWDKTKFTLTEV